jgi:hypothetical protein
MRGRRVAPRDKISSRRRTSGFDAAASDVGDDFLHDHFAPDDLPVRDVSEDQDEPQPAPRVRTKGPGRPVDALHKAIRGREGEGVAPAPTHIGEPASNSALGQELSPEVGARTSQVDVDHPKQPVQGYLPGLEPDKAAGFEPGSSETQALRRRGRRAPARDRVSKAAQMELWPDDPTSTARAEPPPPNPSEG